MSSIECIIAYFTIFCYYSEKGGKSNTSFTKQYSGYISIFEETTKICSPLSQTQVPFQSARIHFRSSFLDLYFLGTSSKILPAIF